MEEYDDLEEAERLAALIEEPSWLAWFAITIFSGSVGLILSLIFVGILSAALIMVGFR